MRKAFFLLVFLFFSTPSFAVNRPPEPVTSEYFKSSLAGLTLDLPKKEIKYILGLKIIKPFPEPVFAEVTFENPADAARPVVASAVINPKDDRFSIISMPVSSPQKNTYYTILVRVYKDQTKKELVAEHSQKILSILNDESIDIWRGLGGLKKWTHPEYRLEISYPAGWNVKEMSSGNNFQAFISVENIDLEGYYSTGIMLLRHITPGLQMEGLSVDHQLINSVVSNMKKVISEERKEVVTERGYEGVISKVTFVNDKGVEEKELLAVFSHERKLTMLLCESPSGDFAKHEKTFYSIIMTAKLY